MLRAILPPSVRPTGTSANAFTSNDTNPAIAKGWSGIMVEASMFVPSIDEGTFSIPLPNTKSTMPPPKLLCLNNARGRPGKLCKDCASAEAVRAKPYTSKSNEPIIDVRGPDTPKSNKSDLFLGDVLRDVIEPVIPLITDGMNVGTVTSNCKVALLKKS